MAFPVDVIVSIAYHLDRSTISAMRTTSKMIYGRLNQNHFWNEKARKILSCENPDGFLGYLILETEHGLTTMKKLVYNAAKCNKRKELAFLLSHGGQIFQARCGAAAGSHLDLLAIIWNEFQGLGTTLLLEMPYPMIESVLASDLISEGKKAGIRSEYYQNDFLRKQIAQDPHHGQYAETKSGSHYLMGCIDGKHIHLALEIFERYQDTYLAGELLWLLCQAFTSEYTGLVHIIAAFYLRKFTDKKSKEDFNSMICYYGTLDLVKEYDPVVTDEVLEYCARHRWDDASILEYCLGKTSVPNDLMSSLIETAIKYENIHCFRYLEGLRCVSKADYYDYLWQARRFEIFAISDYCEKVIRDRGYSMTEDNGFDEDKEKRERLIQSIHSD